MTDAVVPFVLNIDEEQLRDLRRRLDNTRWPDAEVVTDWSQGAPRERVKALVEYWRTQYDWRRCEYILNRLGQFTATVLSPLIYWNELDRGGHFAAFEQPALFVDELRKCFRLVRRVAKVSSRCAIRIFEFLDPQHRAAQSTIRY